MARRLKCKICNEVFDADKEPFVKVSGNRYAHQACADNYEVSQDEIDLKNLHAYLKQLFKSDYDYYPLSKQIEAFVRDNGYTYSGILKSLKYWYDIQGNSTALANGRLGIVPFIYQTAFNYYYSLFLINQKNAEKNLEDYKTIEVKEVRIKKPTRTEIYHKQFDLDEKGE